MAQCCFLAVISLVKSLYYKNIEIGSSYIALDVDTSNNS